MPRFDRLTPATAVGTSKDLLADLIAKHGQIGDMTATMAVSPAVLSGYLQLSKAMRRTKLSRKTSERIWIAGQEQQGCGLCLQSHVDAARWLGIDEKEIDRERNGTFDCAFRSDLPVAWLLTTTHVVLNGAAEEVRTGRLSPDDAPWFIDAILLPAFTNAAQPEESR